MKYILSTFVIAVLATSCCNSPKTAIYLDENDTEPVGWMSVEAGQCAEEPEAPGKEGKIFVGWYTDGGTKYDFSTPVTSDVNIYAKFIDESAMWFKSVECASAGGKITFTTDFTNELGVGDTFTVTATGSE